MSDPSVSRETATPPVPEAARGVFAEHLGVAASYAEALATDGVVRGLIGPREAPRLWERHLLNCAVLEEAVPQGSRVADIGSGAGLPGVVLAIVRPDVRVTLVEPLLRRTTFLEEVVARLGLRNVRVVRGRADALHGSEQFDVVTSRAVAALPKLAQWCLPLVAPHGEMVALKGSGALDEAEEATPELLSRGAAAPRVTELGRGRVAETTWAVRIAWADPSSVSLPAGRSSSPSRGAKGPRRKRGRAHGR